MADSLEAPLLAPEPAAVPPELAGAAAGAEPAGSATPKPPSRGWWGLAGLAASSSALAGGAPADADAHAQLHDAEASARTGGSAAAAVANLSNSIVGAGVMALPHVFMTLGLVPATCLLLAVAALTLLSLNLLLRATVVSGRSSFSDVLAASLGGRGRLAARWAVVVNNLGSGIVFLIIIGDVLVGRGKQPGLLTPLGDPWTRRPVAVGTLLLLLHAPLCMLRRVDSLRFTSALSMCLSFAFISVTLGLVAHKAASGALPAPRLRPAPGLTPSSVLQTLPVLMTAYVCHYNVHPVFAELRAPTEARMRGCVASALALCTLVYWLVGSAGYALFGDSVADDVLMSYGGGAARLGVAPEVGRALTAAVQAGYALALSCTFPLIQVALRQAFFDAFGWGDAGAAGNGRRFAALTAALLATEYAAAMRVPNITVAFGLVGSTVAVLIGFVLPALAAAKGAGAGSEAARWGRALLVVGVAFGVASFSATVSGMLAKGGGGGGGGGDGPPPPPQQQQQPDGSQPFLGWGAW